MSLIKALVFKLWSWKTSHKIDYATHKADTSAHHTKYTDAEAVVAIWNAKHMCRAEFSSDWNCPNATYTYPDFNVEAFDVGDMLNLTTDRITIKKAGKYFMVGKMYFQTAPGAGSAQCRIYKNGVLGNTVDYNVIYVSPAQDAAVGIFALIDASVDDYFKIFMYQETGGNYKVLKKYSYFLSYLVAE